MMNHVKNIKSTRRKRKRRNITNTKIATVVGHAAGHQRVEEVEVVVEVIVVVVVAVKVEVAAKGVVGHAVEPAHLSIFHPVGISKFCEAWNFPFYLHISCH